MSSEPTNGKTYGEAAADFVDLLEILARLRSPRGGCPWDIRQTKEDIGRYLIEEAYELIDAVAEGDPRHQSEELGDLLFQILFISRISEERGEFDISAVLKGIAGKMIRRHPHVFGEKKVNTVGEVKANWEKIKRDLEGREKPAGLLSGISRSLPALARAQKITEKAAAVGFDWPDRDGVFGKIEEELGELREALKAADAEGVQEEIGDLLFSMVNLSRFTGVYAEVALAGSIRKFMARFAYIEKRLKEEGKTPEGATLEEMDRLWDESKRAMEER